MKLIQQFEGLKLKAYKCPAGVWTIGYGNTLWENGTKVKAGDELTEQRAQQLFDFWHAKFENQVKACLSVAVNSNQLNALTSFAYNVGIGNLKRSTLLKKVNANPNDPAIAAEFKKWVRAGGKVLNGLVKRRAAESEMYFKNDSQ